MRLGEIACKLRWYWVRQRVNLCKAVRKIEWSSNLAYLGVTVCKTRRESAQDLVRSCVMTWLDIVCIREWNILPDWTGKDVWLIERDVVWYMVRHCGSLGDRLCKIQRGVAQKKKKPEETTWKILWDNMWNLVRQCVRSGETVWDWVRQCVRLDKTTFWNTWESV